MMFHNHFQMPYTPASLDSLPDRPLRKIFNHCGLKEKENLKRTSSSLRLFHAKHQFDHELTHVMVHAKSANQIYVRLQTPDEVFDITYMQGAGNICSVKHKGGIRTIKREDMATTAGYDLGLILQNQQSRIEELTLAFKEECQTTICEQFVDHFMHGLDDHNHRRHVKLKAEQFRYSGIINETPILKVLDKLQPETLTRIWLNDESDQRFHPIERIMNSDHWKETWEVYLNGFVVRNSLKNFYHIPMGRFDIESVSTHELMELRAAALKLIIFEILQFTILAIRDQRRFLTLFGKPKKTEGNTQIWYFRYKKKTSDNLRSMLRVRFIDKKTFVFQRFTEDQYELIEMEKTEMDKILSTPNKFKI
ncbi:hypothetical protein B9Z55_021042 [Caenorhabditis nigoni]|uniref:DUF38 domain-containing protein n=2 Tax=Caenorhabditis nigoni TaxID=1611254 RepID=A0A2G5TQG1_9PELO|nr:hypothetical protein B9Z55_021042 [Caenorhabditis nigoni]